MCRTSIYEARNNFSALIQVASEGEIVELTRYNRPIAVIMSYEDYEAKRTIQKNWLVEWREEHHDELDDLDVNFTPSKECPDFSKDPWS